MALGIINAQAQAQKKGLRKGGQLLGFRIMASAFSCSDSDGVDELRPPDHLDADSRLNTLPISPVPAHQLFERIVNDP